MAINVVYLTLSKDFFWPSGAKGVIGRDLKFRNVPHHKILTRNIFGLIMKNKMATRGVSGAYISLIIGPRGLGW